MVLTPLGYLPLTLWRRLTTIFEKVFKEGDINLRTFCIYPVAKFGCLKRMLRWVMITLAIFLMNKIRLLFWLLCILSAPLLFGLTPTSLVHSELSSYLYAFGCFKMLSSHLRIAQQANYSEKLISLMPQARQSMSIVSRLSSKVQIWANPGNSDAYFAIDFSLW